MGLGEIFRAERMRRGMTVYELARLTGIAPNTIFNFERGDVQRVSFELVTTLARVYDLSLDVLVFSQRETDPQFQLRQQLTIIQQATAKIAQITGTD